MIPLAAPAGKDQIAGEISIGMQPIRSATKPYVNLELVRAQAWTKSVDSKNSVTILHIKVW
jgi:hypothetical protein